MKNALIRNALQETGMKHWELADLLGIGETTLCRKLRHELPMDEQLAIVKKIEEAKHE